MWVWEWGIGGVGVDGIEPMGGTPDPAVSGALWEAHMVVSVGP
ncbi:hypothetical protein L841_1953 [Mycobacterium sp. MAC_080597_8934]|nr:hypothetical protein L841_1953 [Mycobacterium sp. MAC_080597_8934]